MATLQMVWQSRPRRMVSLTLLGNTASALLAIFHAPHARVKVLLQLQREMQPLASMVLLETEPNVLHVLQNSDLLLRQRRRVS